MPEASGIPLGREALRLLPASTACVAYAVPSNTHRLRLRQFAHLRSSLSMRLRFAALLSFRIFPENEVIQY